MYPSYGEWFCYIHSDSLLVCRQRNDWLFVYHSSSNRPFSFYSRGSDGSIKDHSQNAWLVIYYAVIGGMWSLTLEAPVFLSLAR